MIAFIRKLPIRTKIILIMMIISIISILLVGLVVVLYNNYRARKDLVNDTTLFAQIIANRSTAALTFNEFRLAQENLEALQVKGSIIAGWILDDAGNVFATYGRHNSYIVKHLFENVKSGNNYLFKKNMLYLRNPVMLDGKVIGTVILLTHLREYQLQQLFFSLIVIGVIIVTVIVALLTSSYLQSIISRPLLHLTEIAQNIVRQKKYSFRASVHSDDEIGILVMAFNNMLDMIETQNNTLEQRVAERTAELVIARDRAESADQVKSAFLATMSHELRTPLNSIIGFTGLVLQGLAGPLNKEQQKQLGMVESSGQHLLTLINDVLDISKIEANQVEIAINQFDFRESVKKVVHIVQPLADKKNLQIHIDIHDGIDLVNGDCRRVEQILLNLMSNAIKFTEKGEVRIESERNNAYIVTRVIDTGTGIKAQDIETLFQPFHQLDTGLTRQYEGTGLGLAICKKLVGLMGGTITVQSSIGKGSTFEFTIPSTLEKKT
jgi:signal transduction histidine kinase